MSTFVYIILATLGVSALSLLGGLVLVFSEKNIKKIIGPLVAFSAGALLGGAFLHLIPEGLAETGNIQKTMLFVLGGFMVFLVLEQFINWHHCHLAPSDHRQAVTYLVLISDGVHNFLDGLAVGAAFLVNPSLGLTTVLAITAHEIPQELGDFVILIHGGWEKTQALLFNFLSGLTMVAGGIIAFILEGDIKTAYLLPFAAGNFIYIAASDLVPELKHGRLIGKSIFHFLFLTLGILLMYTLLFIF